MKIISFKAVCPSVISDVLTTSTLIQANKFKPNFNNGMNGTERLFVMWSKLESNIA